MKIGNWEVSAEHTITGNGIFLPGPLNLLAGAVSWPDFVWYRSKWYVVATIWTFIAAGFAASRFGFSFAGDVVTAYLASSLVGLLFQLYDCVMCYRQYSKYMDTPPVV